MLQEPGPGSALLCVAASTEQKAVATLSTEHAASLFCLLRKAQQRLGFSFGKKRQEGRRAALCSLSASSDGRGRGRRHGTVEAEEGKREKERKGGIYLELFEVELT